MLSFTPLLSLTPSLASETIITIRWVKNVKYKAKRVQKIQALLIIKTEKWHTEICDSVMS
jgi:hypothetical protein